MKIMFFLRARLRAHRLPVRGLLLGGLILASVPTVRAADSPTASTVTPSTAVAATASPECDTADCDAPGCDASGNSGNSESILANSRGDCDAPGCDDATTCDGAVGVDGRIQPQLRLGSLFGGSGKSVNCDDSCDGGCDGLGLLDAAKCKTAVGTCGTSNCDAGCDSAGCDSCDNVVSKSCVPCTNQWTVWKEVMFLRRSDASSFPLITDQNTGDTLLNANQLDFQHRAVPRIFLIRDYCDCWGWEIGYFGLQSWDSTGEGGGERSPVLNGPGIPIGSTAPGTIYQANYGSDLHNAEFNVRRRAGQCVTWIAGFRFVEMQEHLRAGSIAPTTTDLYSVDTNNQLYGFQVGANAQVLNCGGRFHVDGIFRAGVFGNNANQTTHSPLGNVIPESVPALSASATQTAFLGELGLRGVYQLTNWLGVYGGYSAIWVDGVALAPAQVSATNLFGTPSATINTTDAVFYHGATVGMQASF